MQTENEKRIDLRGTLRTFHIHTYDKSTFSNYYAVLTLTSRCRMIIESFDERMEAFTDRLARDPVDALSWSGPIFELAAMNEAALQVEALFDKGESMTDIKSIAFDQFTKNSRRGSSASTSATSNITDNCHRQAWFRIYDMIKDV